MSKLNSKKAQGLSLSTVIVAIIVLIVLVVLVMIFTGYFGKVFTPGVKSCTSQGGQCASACNTGQLGSEVTGADCSAAGKELKCCSRIQDVNFERKEGVASCKTQGADCYSDTKPDPADPVKKVGATCADYAKSAFGAPGCPSGTICCN